MSEISHIFYSFWIWKWNWWATIQENRDNQKHSPEQVFISRQKRHCCILGLKPNNIAYYWPNREKCFCTERSFLAFLLKWNRPQLNCIEIDLFRKCWTTNSIAIECWKKLASKLVVFFEIFKVVSENRQHFGVPGLIVHSILLQIDTTWKTTMSLIYLN